MSCSYPKNLLVVNDCVLEGELLVFDEDRQEIEKFGGVADFRPIAPGPRKSG